MAVGGSAYLPAAAREASSCCWQLFFRLRQRLWRDSRGGGYFSGGGVFSRSFLPSREFYDWFAGRLALKTWRESLARSALDKMSAVEMAREGVLP